LYYKVSRERSSKGVYSNGVEYLGVSLRVGQGFARNLHKRIVIVYARLCCKSSHDALKCYIYSLFFMRSLSRRRREAFRFHPSRILRHNHFLTFGGGHIFQILFPAGIIFLSDNHPSVYDLFLPFNLKSVSGQSYFTRKTQICKLRKLSAKELRLGKLKDLKNFH
jgi:hypothetical protein